MPKSYQQTHTVTVYDLAKPQDFELFAQILGQPVYAAGPSFPPVILWKDPSDLYAEVQAITPESGAGVLHSYTGEPITIDVVSKDEQIGYENSDDYYPLLSVATDNTPRVSKGEVILSKEQISKGGVL